MADQLVNDADVLIDYTRGLPQAESYLEGLSSRPSLSALTIADNRKHYPASDVVVPYVKP